MEKLFKISLILSIAGIFFLLFLSNTLEPKLVKIKDINDKMLNQRVKVQGGILSIKTYDSFQVLTIKDETGKIDVTLSSPVNISKNQTIIILGGVSEYEKNLQITADKITKN